MSTHGTLSPARDAHEVHNDLVLSWLAYLLLLPAFLVGFAAAHLPYTVWDYEEGAGLEPWWFDLIVGLILVAITWLPVGLSLLLARRALRAGSRAAWAPIVVGLVLSAAAVVLVVAGALGA